MLYILREHVACLIYLMANMWALSTLLLGYHLYFSTICGYNKSKEIKYHANE